MIREKLQDKKGISAIVLVTGILLLIAIVLIILIPGYINHLKDAKLTMDMQSVETASDVAVIEYLLEREGGLVMYWYDELSHKVTKSKKEAEKIKGFGRSSAEANKNKDTRAAGVPCRSEEDGGPQLLCLTVAQDSIHNIWWSGNYFTYWDYYYMLPEERDLLLKPTDYREMDTSSERTARNRARNRYEEDYKKQLEKEEDPGKVVYNYDLINDILYVDPSCAEKVQQEVKKAPEALPAEEIPAYSLSDVSGRIVQVTVSRDDTSLEWVEGRHGV